MDIDALDIRLADSLQDIPADAWDTLVGDGSPFFEYAWLRAMETTGRVAPDKGWLPHILTAWSADGTLVGAVPMYLKGNSQGEFVYDWAWADLARRMGIDYYPKLIASSPFSPVSGARLLVHPSLDPQVHDAVTRALVHACIQVAEEMGVSGLHFLFVPKPQADLLIDEGLLLRTHFQYHWTNDGYATFDDFLGRFRAKQRNKLKREIRDVQQAGVTFEVFDGNTITDPLMDDLYQFYASTCDKFVWGRTYLNRSFFDAVRANMPDRMRVFLARDSDGAPIAGTFSLAKAGRMYGRYWGCHDEVRFLHFAACCYEPIAYAIEHGYTHFEPGQGGEHKYARGFNPTKTYSAHWIAHPHMRTLLDAHLRREREAVDDHIQQLLDTSPIRPK